MDLYSRVNTGDDELLRNALLHADRARAQTAQLLADLAEIDERKLYVRAGYPALFAYCTEALKLSPDGAQRRIHAARAARRFPAIFAMCADGRLTLTAVNLLAPHLTESNAEEWLAAAAGKPTRELEEFIAARAPRPELIGWLQPLASSGNSHAAPRVNGAAEANPAPALAPARVEPIAAQRFAVQGTVGESAARALRFAQETTGLDVSAVLDAALVLYAKRKKCGATDRPARRIRITKSARHIPAHVRRAVWERDGGRCTFAGDDGHRCGSRRRLEFDHVVPVARGGEATVENVRLRCRAHNQLEAERAFGAGFMEWKREQAAASRCTEAARAAEGDLLAALAVLGYRKAQAKFAAAACASLPPNATLEARVRHALRQVLPPHVHKTRDDLAREFCRMPAHAAPPVAAT